MHPSFELLPGFSFFFYLFSVAIEPGVLVKAAGSTCVLEKRRVCSLDEHVRAGWWFC